MGSSPTGDTNLNRFCKKVCNISFRKDIIENEDLIRQWIEEKLPKSEIARRLSCKTDTLERHLARFNIRYEGNQGGKGVKTYNSSRYIPFETYIKISKGINTNKIRKKLLSEGLKEARCEKCDNTEWNGLPIPLEVHHKDGCKENNQLDNLEMLCPNCHAQTDTYRGRNRKKN